MDDWKPAEAASDDISLAVVAGGTIMLVLLRLKRGTELSELLDRAEGVWEPVGVRVAVEELGVAFCAPAAAPIELLELFDAVIIGNAVEVLVVLDSDFRT